MKWHFGFLLAIGLLVCSTGYAEPLYPTYSPSLISFLTISEPLEFCGERVPIEIQEVRERLEKELLLSLWDRPQVILWLKRSRRYLSPIGEMLQEGGLPDDLKYIAVAESALRPHAESEKGAIGFWQFMKHTGRQYGLVINNHVDERRNLFASTQAALRYFKDLHRIFGSWTLVSAAYNMGGNGLRTEIMEQGIDNYYYLYLPLETQRYVFRVLSAKLIFSNPVHYGFHLSEGDYYPPLQFDRIQVVCQQDTPIRIIAQAAKTHFKEIKDLNPEIRGYALPQGTHSILIPRGASKGFQIRYESLLKDRDERTKRVN